MVPSFKYNLDHGDRPEGHEALVEHETHQGDHHQQADHQAEAGQPDHGFTAGQQRGGLMGEPAREPGISFARPAHNLLVFLRK